MQYTIIHYDIIQAYNCIVYVFIPFSDTDSNDWPNMDFDTSSSNCEHHFWLSSFRTIRI